MKNPFPIKEWCVLVPVKLSAPEIGWLIGGDFKKSARKKLAKPLRAKTDACGIRYCEGNQLEALCLRHIERAACILPKSTIALLQKIEEGRTEVDFLQKEIADRLKLFNQNAVRSREAESRNALSALKMLNQGWADCSIPLRLTKDASGMEAAARELVTFVQTKA